MRLKTLEIKGFKSFADQTQIHFDNNVIGIVGPNGSGKSNIVDAVRWVLGEQKSKELRLDKMNSVLFNGTKKKKQSQAASVSLTFENTKNILPIEYQTVTITRTLFRSGDSEYKLNNVSCRLKDITSLFLDTGIGSNSYAIIALGMVDDLLQDKNNARVRMFEQAAGISKYKKRKRETILKLDSTTADLDRVEDLLYELDEQLKSLEKQVKRAEKYFVIKSEYKTLSIDLARAKIFKVQSDLITFEKEYNTSQDTYHSEQTFVTSFEASLEKLKTGNLEFETKLSVEQKHLNKLVDNIRNGENRLKMLQQKIEFNTSTNSNLKVEIKELQVKIDTLELSIVDLGSKISTHKEEYLELSNDLNYTSTQVEEIEVKHTANKQKLDKILERQNFIHRQLLDLEKEKAITLHKLDSLKKETERSNSLVKDHNAQIFTLREDNKSINIQENELSQLLEMSQLLEEEKQYNLTQKIKLETELKEQISVISRQLDALHNEYKLTKSLVDNMEGYPESIKFLSLENPWQSQVQLLSDIIYVEDLYRVAIENYLQNYLNYYVVTEFEDAYKAINLLNQTQKGKVNFFVLNAYRNNDIQAELQINEKLIPAKSIVKVESSYQTLMDQLLSNVFIDTENRHKKITKKNVTILALDGSFIHNNKTVSGGSVGLFEGKKIGRKKNLQVLIKKIEKKQKEFDTLIPQLNELSIEIQALQATDHQKEIKQTNQLLQQLNQSKATILAKLESLVSYVAQSENQTDFHTIEIDKLENQVKHYSTEINQFNKNLSDASHQSSKADSAVSQIATQLSKITANTIK